MKTWKIEDAVKLYGIDKWSGGYFAADENGDVVITPSGEEDGPRISLHEITMGIKERGLSMPVLLRIENILGQHNNQTDGINRIGDDRGKGRHQLNPPQNSS